VDKLLRTSLVGVLAALVVGATAQVSINEIRRDQPSTDDSEYFELFGTGGFSLEDYTYLVIGDGTGGSGVIECVVSLAGTYLPDDGYFVAAEETFDTTQFGEVVDLGLISNALNFENSDNVTHMLVSGFAGALNDDLDTDDDGILDTTPWDLILDWVSIIIDPTGGDKYYSPTVVGPDGTYAPGHVYRYPDGTGDWNIGEFDISIGQDTPGFPNVPEPGTVALVAVGLAGLLLRRRRA
jgi:hypothetical protein